MWSYVSPHVTYLDALSGKLAAHGNNPPQLCIQENGKVAFLASALDSGLPG